MEKCKYFPGLLLYLQGLVLALLIMPVTAVSDEAILTAEDLNDSLKRMQRIQLEMAYANAEKQPGLLFQLGIEADNLALRLTNEVVVNYMSQRALIDVALERTYELGINYLWFPEKRRFIYDGEVYRQYLELAPQGADAAETAYRLLEHEFFQSSGDDVESLVQSAIRKQDYLDKYADYLRAPKVGILLAVDYRDIWRSYRSSGAEAYAEVYSKKTRNQFHWIIETHPDAQEAVIAKSLLQRFEAELEAYIEDDLVEMERG